MFKLFFNLGLASTFLVLSGCYLTTKTPQKVLNLTSVNKHGDCVSSGIDTTKSNMENVQDQQRCLDHAPQDSIAFNDCMKYVAAHQTVRSLINFCGADHSPYFIGINGATYALEKLDGQPTKHPYFTGKFVGKGLKVQVSNLGLIMKTYQDNSSQDEDNIEQIKFNVNIDVELDGTRASFKGILDEGL